MADNFIRRAEARDLCRIAEIEIFNYRLNFYPIFKSDEFYFGELQVTNFLERYAADETVLTETYVYDDGVVKAFIRISAGEIKKLFVEPVLQGRGIGAAMLEYAVRKHGAHSLWVLEKNTRAREFYARHGFSPTGERKPEEDTDEYLVQYARWPDKTTE